METILNWCAEYWWAVTAALLFVGSVLNSITRYYGDRYPTIVPLFGVILEAISFLTSKGAANGTWGRFKLPLQDVPPGGEVLK